MFGWRWIRPFIITMMPAAAGAVGAGSSAVAVRVAGWRWLSYVRPHKPHQTMKFSWWIHKYEYEGAVETDADTALRQLTEYYQTSSRAARVATTSDGLEVERGSLFFSISGVCPETWCRHVLRVRLQRDGAHRTLLRWNIEMKLCGATAGKNYLIDECKRVISQFAVA